MPEAPIEQTISAALGLDPSETPTVSEADASKIALPPTVALRESPSLQTFEETPALEQPLRLTPEPEAQGPPAFDHAPPISQSPPSIESAPETVSTALPESLVAPPPETPTSPGAPLQPPAHEIPPSPEESVPTVAPSIPESSTEAPEEPAEPAPPRRRYKAKRRVHPAISFSVAVLLIVGVLVGLIVMNRKEEGVGPLEVQAPKVKEEAVARQNFLNEGWMNYSSDTLLAFLKAQSPTDKASYILGGSKRLGAMKAFYGVEQGIDESDTPVDVFDHIPLDIDDRRRGIFLMQYDQPAQVDMRQFFVPVATLEVKHKLEEPDILLSAFADREQYMMEPVRVMAFFKQVDDRLLLDWDVYTQTKYRTLKHFTKNPSPGQRMTFRVMAREVLPPARRSVDASKIRYFRFSDPAHAGDKVDLPIVNSSKPGQILSDIAWINIPGEEADNRYATIELDWTEDDTPQLQLKRVICWEFLGLGGVEGNADPVGTPTKKEPVDLDFLEPDPLGTEATPGAEPETPAAVTLPTEENLGAALEEEELARPSAEEGKLPEIDPIAPGPIETP